MDDIFSSWQRNLLIGFPLLILATMFLAPLGQLYFVGVSRPLWYAAYGSIGLLPAFGFACRRQWYRCCSYLIFVMTVVGAVGLLYLARRFGFWSYSGYEYFLLPFFWMILYLSFERWLKEKRHCR